MDALRAGMAGVMATHGVGGDFSLSRFLDAIQNQPAPSTTSSSTISGEGVDPYRPGNCITGQQEVDRSEEYFLIDGDKQLHFGGQDVVPYSEVRVVDQGTLKGDYPSDYYVTQYENNAGKTVTHFCSVVNPKLPNVAWKIPQKYVAVNRGK